MFYVSNIMVACSKLSNGTGYCNSCERNTNDLSRAVNCIHLLSLIWARLQLVQHSLPFLLPTSSYAEADIGLRRIATHFWPSYMPSLFQTQCNQFHLMKHFTRSPLFQMWSTEPVWNGKTGIPFNVRQFHQVPDHFPEYSLESKVLNLENKFLRSSVMQ